MALYGNASLEVLCIGNDVARNPSNSIGNLSQPVGSPPFPLSWKSSIAQSSSGGVRYSWKLDDWTTSAIAIRRSLRRQPLHARICPRRTGGLDLCIEQRWRK